MLVVLVIVAIVVVSVVLIKKIKKTKEEELRKKEQEQLEQERLEQERLEREIQRKEEYKKDILSGAISYDAELQQIADEVSKCGEKAVEFQSMLEELHSYINTHNLDNWDTSYYSMITNRIKNADLDIPYRIERKLFELSEIKWDARITELTGAIKWLEEAFRRFYFQRIQLRLG